MNTSAVPVCADGLESTWRSSGFQSALESQTSDTGFQVVVAVGWIHGCTHKLEVEDGQEKAMILCSLTSWEGELRDRVSLWEPGLELAQSLLLRWSSLVAVSGRLVPALYFFTSDYYTKRRTEGKKDTSVFPCSCNPLSAVNIDVFRKIAGATRDFMSTGTGHTAWWPEFDP